MLVKYVWTISIHTPARGVTMAILDALPVIIISIHTPARGVTVMVWYSGRIGADFNPHSRKGSDR